jgi:D-alanine--poly(phosphoribitol) ligase subunit 2
VNTTDAEVEAKVTEIIRDRLNAEVPSPRTDLIESGLLDSLALVMLIAALEETFACELLVDDFDLERFRSVERIVAYLQACGIVAARDGW